jgi:hypothetical protein
VRLVQPFRQYGVRIRSSVVLAWHKFLPAP